MQLAYHGLRERLKLGNSSMSIESNVANTLLPASLYIERANLACAANPARVCSIGLRSHTGMTYSVIKTRDDLARY